MVNVFAERHRQEVIRRARGDFQVPSLQHMAALKLFHTTPNLKRILDGHSVTRLKRKYAEGSVDWRPYAAPATTIQRIIRSYLIRARALLGKLERTISGDFHRFPNTPTSRELCRRHIEGEETRKIGDRARTMHFAKLSYRSHKWHA